MGPFRFSFVQIVRLKFVFDIIDDPVIVEIEKGSNFGRIRQLRTKILNELFNGQANSEPIGDNDLKEPITSRDAKT